jgi:hypothetical protein
MPAGKVRPSKPGSSSGWQPKPKATALAVSVPADGSVSPSGRPKSSPRAKPLPSATYVEFDPSRSAAEDVASLVDPSRSRVEDVDTGNMSALLQQPQQHYSRVPPPRAGWYETYVDQQAGAAGPQPADYHNACFSPAHDAKGAPPPWMSVMGMARSLPLASSFTAGKNSLASSQEKAAVQHIDFMIPRAPGKGRRVADGVNAAAVMSYKPKIVFDHRLALDGAGGYESKAGGSGGGGGSGEEEVKIYDLAGLGLDTKPNNALMPYAGLRSHEFQERVNRARPSESCRTP